MNVNEHQNTGLAPAAGQRVFDIVPHKDDGFIIVQARRDALRDHVLDYGARVLFCYLLDLSLNASVWRRRGSVTISSTKLSEHLGCGRRSIYEWHGQLAARNHIWLSSHGMPNCWEMNTYHISALDAPSDPTQTLRQDGLWGNGARRGHHPAPPANPGGEGGVVQNLPTTDSASKIQNSSFSEQNAHGSDSQTHLSGAKFAPGMGKTCSGHEQSLLRARAKLAPGSGKKLHVAGAKKCTRQEQKTAHIGKPIGKESGSREKVLSCLTAEPLKPANPSESQEANQFSGSSAQKAMKGEREWLERLGMIVGPKEMSNWGGRWRNRYRENPEKAVRMLAELKSMHRENRIVRNAGACADDLWRRFSP